MSLAISVWLSAVDASKIWGVNGHTTRCIKPRIHYRL